MKMWERAYNQLSKKEAPGTGAIDGIVFLNTSTDTWVAVTFDERDCGVWSLIMNEKQFDNMQLQLIKNDIKDFEDGMKVTP